MIDTKKIYKGGVLIEDKSAVVEGRIEVIHFEPKSQGLKPIFTANDFVLFDKPSGLKVHPRNRKSSYTLIDEVKSQFGMDANIVHRIDKETSGLVLAARNKKSEKILKGLFEARAIKKRYLALVSGDLKEATTIDAPLALNRDFSEIKIKAYIDAKGKKAVTFVRPLKRLGDFTLIEAIPLTGRQHQIRAHLFHVKHPIVGDPIYGPSTDVSIRYLDGLMDEEERLAATGAKRLMLHAYSLEFTYNDTKYNIVSKKDFLQDCFMRTE